MSRHSSESEPRLSSCLQEEFTPAPDVAEETEEEVRGCGGGRVFSPEDHRAIGGAVERLGLRLLEKLPVGPQQPNVVLSPLSLALALAQLTLGQSMFSFTIFTSFWSSSVGKYTFPFVYRFQTSCRLCFPNQTKRLT